MMRHPLADDLRMQSYYNDNFRPYSGWVPYGRGIDEPYFVTDEITHPNNWMSQ